MLKILSWGGFNIGSDIIGHLLNKIFCSHLLMLDLPTHQENKIFVFSLDSLSVLVFRWWCFWFNLMWTEPKYLLTHGLIISLNNDECVLDNKSRVTVILAVNENCSQEFHGSGQWPEKLSSSWSSENLSLSRS